MFLKKTLTLIGTRLILGGHFYLLSVSPPEELIKKSPLSFLAGDLGILAAWGSFLYEVEE